jgi:hypothetical protein
LIGPIFSFQFAIAHNWKCVLYQPVRELLASILNDEGCRWSAAPEVPVFQHGLPRSNDASAPVPAPPVVDEPQQHDDESEHDEDGDEDDDELYIDEDQSYHSDE